MNAASKRRVPDNLGMSNDLARLLDANFPALDWSAPRLSQLAPLVRRHRLAAGAVVFAQGQVTPALFGVVAGEVEIRLGTVDGAVSVVEVTGDCRLFGLASFASGLPSTYEAVTRAPTRLLAFGALAYRHLMDEVPGFARALMAEFACRHDTTMRLLTAARHQGAMERLTLALARLVSEQPEAHADAQGWRRLRVTQAQLAALAGLTRQTVNEMLNALSAQRRVRIVYGGLWLAP